MKKDQIIEEIRHFNKVGNELLSYYVTYKVTDNITSQKWGKYCELKGVLDEIEKEDACIQGELPIVRLIVHSTDQCLAFLSNPLWNCVDDDSDMSHVVMTVPFISPEGKFGNIVSEKF